MGLPEIGKVRWSPLGIIAAFLAVTETATVVGAVNTKEFVQLLFAWFSIGFPVLVLILFFIALFVCNHVFYTPWDFEASSAQAFVDAMKQKKKRKVVSKNQGEAKNKKPSADPENPPPVAPLPEQLEEEK